MMAIKSQLKEFQDSFISMKLQITKRLNQGGKIIKKKSENK